MKFYIRRAVFGIVSMPVVFTGYGLVYFSLGLAVNSPEGIASVSVGAFVGNLPSIGIGYVLATIFAPQLNKFLNKSVSE